MVILNTVILVYFSPLFRLSDNRLPSRQCHVCCTMGDLWTKVTIGLLKGVAFVYDILAFVPYYFIDNPSQKLAQSRRIKVSFVVYNYTSI